MKFYDIRLFPHGAGAGSLVEYDSSDPVEIEEALSRGFLLRTGQRVGGKDLGLRKMGSEYELMVTSPPAGPSSKFPHETLEGALKQVAELVKLAEELEGA